MCSLTQALSTVLPALVLSAAATPATALRPADEGSRISHPAPAASTTDSSDAIATLRAVFAAAERGDMLALDSLYARDSLTVVEGAGINRGWADYRDHHLGPEVKVMKNLALFRSCVGIVARRS